MEEDFQGLGVRRQHHELRLPAVQRLRGLVGSLGAGAGASVQVQVQVQVEHCTLRSCL